jgi:hypothetical protein
LKWRIYAINEIMIIFGSFWNCNRIRIPIPDSNPDRTLTAGWSRSVYKQFRIRNTGQNIVHLCAGRLQVEDSMCTFVRAAGGGLHVYICACCRWRTPCVHLCVCRLQMEDSMCTFVCLQAAVGGPHVYICVCTGCRWRTSFVHLCAWCRMQAAGGRCHVYICVRAGCR